MCWKTCIPALGKPTYITREGRSWKSFDAGKFRADLLSSSLCQVDFNTPGRDVVCAQQQDILVDQYVATLTDILNRHAPISTTTTRLRPRTDPWFDEECRAAKKHARLLERRFKRWNSDNARSVWIQALHDLHKLVDKKRTNFWRAKVGEQPNARATWRVVDNILCRERTKPNAPSLSADVFADHFDTKIEDIRSATDGAPPPTYIGCSPNVDFQSFSRLDTADTMRLIKEAPMKQCALDPIPTWLLKDCADLLAPYITRVINSSLCTGYVPTALKQAYITPLLKKPGLDENDATNYRPVSNLSVLSKLLEKAVSRQLKCHLSGTELFPSYQSAYRKHHSTETALTRVCSDLITHLDKGDSSLVAFLDLSAAFDTVDKQILLSRLSRSFGVNATALEWFCSYLSDRTQYVLYDNSKSLVRQMKYGVPQGSVLGPVLFVLYTADLEHIACQHDVFAHFYADDSQLYVFGKPAASGSADNRLLQCLDDIASWMKSNRLKLNPTKTQFMRCATKRRIAQLDTEPIEFCGENITPVTSVRNLGVVVDMSLTFHSHISRVVSSCFYQMRRLKGSLKALPFDTAKTIVNSFVISRIDYCNSLLAGMPKCSLDRLQGVMNAAARLLCHVGMRAHVSSLLRDRLHWLRMPQRVQYKLCLLTFKALHGMAPEYISELCHRDINNAARSRLRSATHGDLQLPITRTQFGDRAFAVAGPRAWNSLPSAVRSTNSLASFKSLLKTHLFNDI